MKLIAAVDENWAIGNEGGLLFRISEDLKRFAELTRGNAVIMGRKTYESIGRPLPDRLNIVMTKSGEIDDDRVITYAEFEGILGDARRFSGCMAERTWQRVLAMLGKRAVTVRSPEKAVEAALAAGFTTDMLFIIGGESVYRMFEPAATTAYITHVRAEAPAADAYFPRLCPPVWRLDEQEESSGDGLSYAFCVYRRG